MATCSPNLSQVSLCTPVNVQHSKTNYTAANSFSTYSSVKCSSHLSVRNVRQIKGGNLASHRQQGWSTSSASLSGSRKVICEASDAGSLGDSPHDGNVKEISSKEEFVKYTTEAGDRLVVLDISTRTCGPCKFIYPKVVQMSLDYPDVVFLKIMGDKDESTRALMREWGVRAVPNFRFYRNGELIHKHNGANEDVLREHFMSFYSTVAA